MCEIIRAIKGLRSLANDMRKSKTAFNDLVEEGVLDSFEAQEYMDELNDEQPEVAHQVAQVLKRKSASVGFGKVSDDHQPRPTKRETGTRFSDADMDLMNIDFGGF